MIKVLYNLFEYKTMKLDEIVLRRVGRGDEGEGWRG
jgi:hypothetical protein